MAPSKKVRLRKGFDPVWNFLTILLIIGIVAVVAVTGILYMNPYLAFNPYPPEQIPPTVVIPTSEKPTEGPLVFPPTWTPTATLEPTATRTPAPTSTSTSTPVPPTPPLGTPPTETPTYIPGAYSFEIIGSPEAIASTTFRPDSGCNGMWLAGRVLDISGAPLNQMIIQLHGSIGGKLIDGTGLMISVSGFAPIYGPAGYEFWLADKPIASRGTLWVQLTDQANLALSPKIYFDTYDDCSKNLILINFKQVR